MHNKNLYQSSIKSKPRAIEKNVFTKSVAEQEKGRK